MQWISKLFAIVLIFGLVSTAPMFSAKFFAETLPGGVLCNVTQTGSHSCGLGLFGIIAGSTACTAPAMQTTQAVWWEYANWLEIPTNDNCSNYTDNLGYSCELYANEPVNTACTVHVWGPPY